ncbi:hypothetical protein M153_2500045432 [Pseudoloma neurophilia]|uniref:C2H2-type domain-containing protein n=1 Tax=Pseudoloma neurophilia TaxID=146866 RepID=A0A0R0M0N6_9MICR|nr:hypothetical protein M153_2500045432 [Pseudoloma neurophilia]
MPTTIRNFSCLKCSKVFRTSIQLKSHENIHLALKPFKCEVCERAYPSMKSLLEHGKTHKKATFICKNCKKAFYYKYKLSRHEKICQVIYKCVCGKIYIKKAHFLNHQFRVHSIEGRNSIKKELQDTKNHLKTANQDLEMSNISQLVIKKYRFPCKFCKKKFETDKLRGNHEILSHPETSPRDAEQKNFNEKNGQSDSKSE